MTPTELMQLAIDKCREGITAGQSPFGCAIAKGDEIIAVCHNTVVATTDITAHAEINALRLGCQQVGDIFLEDCIVASTCEPFPMCMSALHWARVPKVYFGATIADAETAGFSELQLAAAEIVRIGGSLVELESGLLANECMSLFDEWLNSPSPRRY